MPRAQEWQRTRNAGRLSNIQLPTRPAFFAHTSPKRKRGPPQSAVYPTGYACIDSRLYCFGLAKMYKTNLQIACTI